MMALVTHKTQPTLKKAYCAHSSEMGQETLQKPELLTAKLGCVEMELEEGHSEVRWPAPTWDEGPFSVDLVWSSGPEVGNYIGNSRLYTMTNLVLNSLS